MRYRYMSHTADTKFRAYGMTLEEAFANSVSAAFSVMFDTEKVKPAIKKEIQISSGKLESLLYDFIEEFLFLLDTDGFFPGKMDGMEIKEAQSGFTLRCTALGDSYKNYSVAGHIKSITYNDMQIKKEKGRFVIQAVVDT